MDEIESEPKGSAGSGGTASARKSKRRWQVGLGAAVTVGTIWYAARGIPFDSVLEAIRGANFWTLLFLSAPFYVWSNFVRALRWRHLIKPVAEMERPLHLSHRLDEMPPAQSPNEVAPDIERSRQEQQGPEVGAPNGFQDGVKGDSTSRVPDGPDRHRGAEADLPTPFAFSRGSGPARSGRPLGLRFDFVQSELDPLAPSISLGSAIEVRTSRVYI